MGVPVRYWGSAKQMKWTQKNRKKKKTATLVGGKNQGLLIKGPQGTPEKTRNRKDRYFTQHKKAECRKGEENKKGKRRGTENKPGFITPKKR